MPQPAKLALLPSPFSMKTLRPFSLVDYLFACLALFGLVALGALVANLLAEPGQPGFAGQSYAVRIYVGGLVGPSMLLTGSVILSRARTAMGRFLIIWGLGGIVSQLDLNLGTPWATALAHIAIMLYGPGVMVPALGYAMLTFPDGKVYPAALAPWAWAYAVVKFTGAALEIMASPSHVKFVVLPINPLLVPGLIPYQPLIAATIGTTGVMLPAGVAIGLVSLLLRYRQGNLPQRQQIKWVVWSASLVAIGVMLAIGMLASGARPADFTPLLVVVAGTFLLYVASLTIAILRYHLFDIDLIINRTLVYGSLTAVIAAIYIVAVGALAMLLRDTGSVIVSLLATGLVAVLFQPLRERLQRGANRLLYGERDDPYTVLSRLGQRLEATLETDALLPALAESVAQALKLPYVGISLREGDGFRMATEYGLARAPGAGAGDAQAPLECLPLTYQHETIGQLLIEPRARGEAFTPSEQRLLTDIAHQAGAAAHAMRLTAALHRSRERMVTTREEERRRLRRDLHDGLGPALAAHTLKAGTARALLARDPEAAARLLEELERDIEAAVGDIRRLVYELRPPALDELGLAGALRDTAGRYSSNGLRVTVEAPEQLPALPAAAEVAAYRIAQEALTNVVRHAQARRCSVNLAVGRALQLEIRDDGRGLPANRKAGVGLASMRERAEELGGTCLIENAPGGGTRVVAELPISHA